MTSGLFSLAIASGRTGGQDEGVAMGLENLFGWFGNQIAAVIAIGAAGVAVAAAWMGWRETQKQRILQAQNIRHNLDAQSLSWGNACIDTLNRAAMFARTRQHQATDASFLQQRVNMMLAISSLIDRGGLFFPNIDPLRQTSQPAKKNGSLRAPIMEALHLVRLEIEALTRQGGPTAANSAEFIDDCRALLVSELEAYFDVQRQETVAKRYNDQSTPHRMAAMEQANILKSHLKSRRPGIVLSDQKETVQ